jgi:hypothetical protein
MLWATTWQVVGGMSKLLMPLVLAKALGLEVLDASSNRDKGLVRSVVHLDGSKLDAIRFASCKNWVPIDDALTGFGIVAFFVS